MKDKIILHADSENIDDDFIPPAVSMIFFSILDLINMSSTVSLRRGPKHWKALRLGHEEAEMLKAGSVFERLWSMDAVEHVATR